ncbi:MAG TPA: SIMPL domain-containing protein [Sphingomicrobium sp.]|nr:SIMPL domain-containing protein [Sphingomicrobium sp.]
MRILLATLLAAAAVPAAPAMAQVTTGLAQPITGTRLELTATGEATRVPNLAMISAGVVTRAPTATAALQQNSSRMERVLAALRRVGIAERDIQTSAISLNPEYQYQENQPPRLVAYTASNQVTIRFRDIRNSGQVLDILVAEGANQISGPNMTIERPEEALDEARTNAVAAGRARAELYARALGKRVARVISVSEGGGYYPPPPMPMAERAVMAAAKTEILPGDQKLQVSLAMVFELQ